VKLAFLEIWYCREKQTKYLTTAIAPTFLWHHWSDNCRK